MTNPLSVKTKVHVPKSPTATLSREERDKVFLEVHVQNLTSEPMCFERMHLDPVEGWDVDDLNFYAPTVSVTEDPAEGDTSSSVSIFSGTTGIMQPQDTRQYLFVLTPKVDNIPSFPIIHQPGSNIALGRLDISWRTGRLLTSVSLPPSNCIPSIAELDQKVLSRRIPLLPVPPPAPAIPPHLQPSGRPQSPGPQRPGSPAFRVRNQPSGRPQSPGPAGVGAPPNPQHIERPDVEVDLIVRNRPTAAVVAEEAFMIDFTLTVSALLPPTSWPRAGAITPAQAHVERDRVLRVVVQHSVPPRQAAVSQSLENAQNARITPEPTTSTLAQSPPYALRRSMSTLSLAKRSESTIWGETASTPTGDNASVIGMPGSTLVQSPTAATHEDRFKHTLPSPFRDVSAAVLNSKQGLVSGDLDIATKDDQAVIFLGPSTLRLPPIRMSRKEIHESASEEAPPSAPNPPRSQQSLDFSVQYLAMREGFSIVGGLKAFLVEDRELLPEELLGSKSDSRMEPKLLKDWESVGEVWARSPSMFEME